jgi:hypothetical protein
MLDRLFIAYRFKALQRFIFEQLDQLYQLGVLVSLVLYTALPGLVLIIYLALGKLVVNDPDLALLLCVSLIVFQTELSTALSEGVRDTRNRLFQRSLLGLWHLILLDTVFGLLTNVVFLLCLPLLYSMGLDRLEQASHFLLFITVIVLSGLCATFKPQVTKVYIIIVVLCACLLPLSFSAFLIVCIACLLIALCLPLRHLLGQQWDLGFWCGYHRHNFAEIWWRILLLAGLVMCAFVIFDARPDLGFFCALFNISISTLYSAESATQSQSTNRTISNLVCEFRPAHKITIRSVFRSLWFMFTQSCIAADDCRKPTVFCRIFYLRYSDYHYCV